MPINCYKCGRFVGKDGYTGIVEVDNGVYECAYPECRKCLEKAADAQEGGGGDES